MTKARADVSSVDNHVLARREFADSEGERTAWMALAHGITSNLWSRTSKAALAPVLPL